MMRLFLQVRQGNHSPLSAGSWLPVTVVVMVVITTTAAHSLPVRFLDERVSCQLTYGYD